VDSRAARDQAVGFAVPDARVEVVRPRKLTGHGRRQLRDACQGHDLLALGAGPDVFAIVKHASIPVLIGRWNPLSPAVTERILVAVDGSPGSDRAVQLAGRLAADHDGTVVVVVTPERDAHLERAIAASRRILMQTTGRLPRVIGKPLARDQAIASAAVEANASLVVLAGGDGYDASGMAATAARIECSVLCVPTVGADPTPGAATDARAEACRGSEAPVRRCHPAANQEQP
jgi:nucleotide-binding universal stress UspA family protein